VVGPLSDIWSVEVQCACTALRQIEQKDFRAVSLGFQAQDRLGFSGVREMTRDGSDTSSPDVAQERRVMVQWDRLLSMGEPDGNAVRPLVGHSWVRRKSSGVDPARTNASTPFAHPCEGRPTFRMTMLEVQPGAKIPPHTHAGPGIRYMLDGAITIAWKDRGRQRFKAGSTYYEGAGSNYSPSEMSAFNAAKGVTRVLIVELVPKK
jgi:hypothetical protein